MRMSDLLSPCLLIFVVALSPLLLI